MTDGQSNTGASWGDLQASINRLHAQNIPVYAITFGDADVNQLSQIVNYTSGKMFDGKSNLVLAIRTAKGYNQ
jgi:Ca-activated chloride channel family protein